MRINIFRKWMSLLVLTVALMACGGSGSDDNSPNETSATSNSSPNNNGSSNNEGSSETENTTDTSDQNSGNDTANEEGTGNETSNSGSGPEFSGATNPGCGLSAATFCDTFDEPSENRGRSGEMNAQLWSAARSNPQLATSGDSAMAAGAATLRECRGDLPEKVYPSTDALICNPTTYINSNHLLVAVGSQNYGQNSYRIRQPFDFSNRTGTLVFDAQGYYYNSLIGWIGVAITEDPTPIPSFAFLGNDEGGAVPRNGVEFEFQITCGGSPATGFSLRMINIIDNFIDTPLFPDSPPCISGAVDKLNHFEIQISKNHIEVYISPVSEDGVTFEPMQLVYSVDVNLPFERGYVHLTTHNHASLKYTGPTSPFHNQTLDAWISRWDNVGFDGPIINNWREYEIPDSLTVSDTSFNIPAPVVNTAYKVKDVSDNSAGEIHWFQNVDLTGVSRARLALATWYNMDGDKSNYILKYRVNGGNWLERKFSSAEQQLVITAPLQGAMGQMLDIPLNTLIQGDNSIEFRSENIPQNYPPAVSAMDLILERN